MPQVDPLHHGTCLPCVVLGISAFPLLAVMDWPAALHAELKAGPVYQYAWANLEQHAVFGFHSALPVQGAQHITEIQPRGGD